MGDEVSPAVSPVAIGSGDTIAIAEVLSLRVPLLAELPLPCTLTVRVPGLEAVYGAPVVVLLTTSRQRAQEAARTALQGRGPEGGTTHLACLTPVEYEALAVAMADGRLTHAEAHRELARKAQAARQGREHRLTRERLLGPVRAPDGGGEAWTVGMLVEALRGTCEGVRVEDGGAHG